jgi:L-amino acid N-acyltransferase YncA
MRFAPFIWRELPLAMRCFNRLPDWAQRDEGHLPVCRLVARAEAGVLGWAALSAVSGRPVYAGVAEVSVYVAERARGAIYF